VSPLEIVATVVGTFIVVAVAWPVPGRSSGVPHAPVRPRSPAPYDICHAIPDGDAALSQQR
jgi:hypothetical protein